MPVTWILISDSHCARIFEARERLGSLQEVERFENPAADAGDDDHASDLSNDTKLERFRVQTADPQVFPVAQASDAFARTITNYLNQARIERRYDSLYLVAAPAFLGLIRGNLQHEVQRMVEEEIPANMSSYDVRRIEHFLDSKFE